MVVSVLRGGQTTSMNCDMQLRKALCAVVHSSQPCTYSTYALVVAHSCPRAVQSAI